MRLTERLPRGRRLLVRTFQALKKFIPIVFSPRTDDVEYPARLLGQVRGQRFDGDDIDLFGQVGDVIVRLADDADRLLHGFLHGRQVLPGSEGNAVPLSIPEIGTLIKDLGRPYRPAD